MAKQSQIFYKKMYPCVYTAVNNQRIIIHTLGHKKGIMHDYNIYKRNQYMIPKQVVDGYDWISSDRSISQNNNHI